MRDYKGLNEIVCIIRRDIVLMIYRVKFGYLGGLLLVVEIFIVLYFDEMNVDFLNFKMEDRDRFVLLKGYVVLVLYVILVEKGYFDKEELNGLRKIGRML